MYRVMKDNKFEDVTALLYPGKAPALERGDIQEMDIAERKRRLARFAREDIYDSSGRPHRVSAIQSIIELDKLDGSYAPQRHRHEHIVFEVVLVDRPKPQPLELPKGEDILAEGIVKPDDH